MVWFQSLTAGLQTSLISGTCKCNHILKKHILDDFVDSTAFAIPILASGIGRYFDVWIAEILSFLPSSRNLWFNVASLSTFAVLKLFFWVF